MSADDRDRRPTARPVNEGDHQPPPDPPSADEAEEEAAPPPDPDSLRAYFRDPGVRNYLFAALAALAMVFVVLFQRGSDVGGVLLLMVGAAGLVLRWSASPPMFVVILTWFLVFPYGVPDADYRGRYEVIEGHFRLADVILVFSAVVYLLCQYRLLGLMTQALPHEAKVMPRGTKPFKRPLDLILPGELGRLLALTGAAVIAGQLVWLFVTTMELDPGEDIPIRLAPANRYGRVQGESGPIGAGTTRFILLAGLIVFTTLAGRLAFGYWRLRNMGRAEAGMLLQDEGWNEVRREAVRAEVWRKWGLDRARRRAEREAKKAARGADR